MEFNSLIQLNPQQSNNRLFELLAKHVSGEKGCGIWLDWLTRQHRLADTPGTGCLQSPSHKGVTWLRQHYSQSIQWSENALTVSIYNQAGVSDKKSPSWFISPGGGQALRQTNCITLLCRSVIYMLFLWQQSWMCLCPEEPFAPLGGKKVNSLLSSGQTPSCAQFSKSYEEIC